jgi:hypothetical protein
MKLRRAQQQMSRMLRRTPMAIGRWQKRPGPTRLHPRGATDARVVRMAGVDADAGVARDRPRRRAKARATSRGPVSRAKRRAASKVRRASWVR